MPDALSESSALKHEDQPQAIREAIDAVSRAVAVGVALLYISGFLIMSIYDFHYGFSEMNPLRPRILAAGGWFLLFLALPFALVRELLKHKLWKTQMKWWQKASLLAYAYYVSCIAVVLLGGFLFAFDYPAAGHMSIASKVITTINIAALILFGMSMAIPKVSDAIKAIAVIAFLGCLFYSAYDSIFIQEHFQMNAILLWMMVVGFISFIELKLRSGKMTLGDWPMTLVWLLGASATFASLYYPHLKSSWGGGTPIPITMTMTKDSTVLSGQQISCVLIDETDSGFYVVAKDNEHATYIPRASVALIHFAETSKSSLTTKAK